jgi:hypothetical protein
MPRAVSSGASRSFANLIGMPAESSGSSTSCEICCRDCGCFGNGSRSHLWRSRSSRSASAQIPPSTALPRRSSSRLSPSRTRTVSCTSANLLSDTTRP